MEETTYQKIKTHINANKYRYGCAILGGAVVILLLKKNSTITSIVNVVSPVFNNSNDTVLGGHLRKIVYCLELDKYFDSVTDSAKFAGVPISAMSRHLNGHNEHINGMHYKIIGVAS